MANSIDPAIKTKFRRAVGLDSRRAVVGDVSGVVYEPGKPGYVRVTYPESGGRSFSTVVRLRININLPPGTPVVVGFDRDNQPAIIDIDFDGMVVGNWNPLQTGIVSPVANATDLNLSPILLSTAFGTSKPLYVTLFPFKYIRNGTLYKFAGASGGIDLSSYVPGSANQWCLVGIFILDDGTYEIKSSTVQSTSEPLTDTDIQESITLSSDGSIPVAFWRLTNGVTQIADTDKWWDARQWINVPDYSVATVQTSNNTQTTLVSVTVVELSLLTITGTFSGVKSDYSAVISGTFVAGVRRATAGNATLVGVTVTSNEDSSGTPALTVDADTGTQTARIRVTGISAEVWNWSVKYSNLVT